MSDPKKMKSQEKVLILGSGGREHVLAWKIAQSSHVQDVFVAPGNAGTHGSDKMTNVDIKIKDFDEVCSWCKKMQISLVIVGPEDPLANGISDHLAKEGIPCFGPSAKAAQIEASKDFAKNFMVRHNIPTARFKSFSNVEEACEHIRTAPYKALVVKASGLAAGKGVIVADSVEEACAAAKEILGTKIFGNAGDILVVEELLEGEEVSCLAFSDGTTVAMMPPAQDHKRLNDGDKGPNTGGMGAYCPYPKISEEKLVAIKQDVLQKAVDGMKSEGMPYVGVLYAGLMITDDGPHVLEFNCRFGDPETQSILPLLKSDLFVVGKACVEGTLHDNMPEFDQESKVLGVVVVSGGYPGSYKKGIPITGLKEAHDAGLTVFHAGTAMKDNQLVSSGGRVLAVVAKEKDFQTAYDKAQQGAALIQFTDAFYRKDIGYKVLTSSIGTGLSYKEAGVDIAAGNSLVELIKPLAKSTRRPGCDAALGSFGAIFNLQQASYSSNSLLVSATDGVGTKLKIAQAVGFHKSIGIDLVAMVVNDILAHGAEPLFFLDYFACGYLDVAQARDVIEGIAQGCKQAGCALVGGETAEMAGMYTSGEYDVAGFAVGAVEKLLIRLEMWILPNHLAVEIDASSWSIPPIFGWLQQNGKVSAAEMVKTYNCGLGGILIVSQQNVVPVAQALSKADENGCIVGTVVNKGDFERVSIQNLETSLQHCYKFENCEKKKNVAVLISGSGTNLQALIDHTQCPGNKSSAQIVLVISNKANVKGLERAHKAGIPSLVINHKLYKSREEFDDAVHEELVHANVDLVCLAGFMRILSGSFVRKWTGRILNVHPSLLPSFKGANAHKLVLESGVRISGCTVHFVAEEIDSGAILVQKSVPVFTSDTEASLSERVKRLEHIAYPSALEMVASDKAVLQENGKVLWKE
ncbi:GART [Acanthosepion pharaonis]|uniref:Trifunctional purine biosynthetic protein adenosine-3 n=1 Tax=Acanthosepion pharaonis TaxID=158019 RepID=A0A812BE68_ACAPH|nr:GART [Sepia pharaonis]